MKTKHTGSLFLCLNAEDGNLPKEIQLLPAEEFVVGKDGRRWTKKDIETIVKKSNEYLPHHPIDENHSTDLKAREGKPSPAMGWFGSVYSKDDGSIWSNTEWTLRGKKALENKEYRYISPVFETSESGEIVKIMRAGLTNIPNLDLPNLNNEQLQETKPEQAGKPAQEDFMNKEICAALGLPETATENDVVAAISKLKTQANSQTNVDLSVYAPRVDLNQMEARAVEAEKKLAELNAEALKEKATTAVEKAITDRKIAPASKDAYLQMCSSQEGLANFQKIMESTPAIIPEGKTVDGEPPASSEATELNAEELEVCKAAGYTVEEFKKLKGGQ